MTASAIDFYLPKRFSEGSVTYQRSQYLILFCHILSIATLVVIVYDWTLSPLDDASRMLGLALKAPILAVYAGVPFILKFGGSYGLCARLLYGSIVIVGVLAVFVSGGPVRSPSTFILLLPVMVSFFLLGMREGLLTTLLCLICLAVLFTLDLSGYSFPLGINEGALDVMDMVVTLVFLFAAIGVTAAYEASMADAYSVLNGQKEKFESMAHSDMLTGLGNRYGLMKAEAELKAIRGTTPRVTVIDLDDFKSINDRYNHAEGDAYLQEVARRIDTLAGDNCKTFRIGGDEFLLLEYQPLISDGDQASRIQALCESPIIVGGRQHKLSFSIGMASWDSARETLEDVFKRADLAMYAEKYNRAGARNSSTNTFRD